MDGLNGKLSISEQNTLLGEITPDTSLADLLSGKNLSYEALRYIESPDVPNDSFSKIELLDNIVKRTDGIPAVSFFSGAGGFDVGFSYAGFNNLISIEINEVFCNTLRRNCPEKIVIGPPDYSGDIRQHDEIAALLRLNGIHEYFPGVFHGGPPCQSFSIAANQRFSKEMDEFKRKGFFDEEKGMLFFDYVWFIKEFRPLAFLIENVAGILDCDSDGKIQKALDELEELGYIVTQPQIINAANYGVPQNRFRFVVAGTRGRKQIIWPKASEELTSCGNVFMRDIGNAENHQTRKHTAESIIRYMKLPYGGRDKMGRVDRLDPRLPSKTVIAGGTKGGGRSHLHPFTPRTLSVRECARLQTFPDSYVFTGTTARQFTQVGNAVPPLLAYKLASAIREAIE